MSNTRKIILPAIIGVILAVIIFWHPFEKAVEEELEEVAVVDSSIINKAVFKYNLPLNNYDVTYGVVANGQNLSSILKAHGIDGNQVHQLVQKSKGVFDVRKIKTGQSYALFFPQDTLDVDTVFKSEPEFFVYNISIKEFVVFDLRDAYNVTIGVRPSEWISKTVHGTVKSSLWNAMPENDASPLLAISLSDIYAWSIDFFGLSPQDEFRVLYEEEVVDGQCLNNFRINGACFTHDNQNFYAIPYNQGEFLSFYDETGKNVEKAFLKAPLNFFRISSTFSNSRFHPVLKLYRAHHGVDYAAPTGTPVFTIGDGVVVAKSYQANGGGNYVKIKHNATYQTSYMHLSRFAAGLHVGQHVKQKEVIGYVGSTGLATGPHLDFRVYKNGTPINPLTVKSEPKESIRPENMDKFTVLCDTIMSQLKML